MTTHPADETIAAYLSGALDLEERDALQAHLADCRDCRVHVTSARRLLTKQPAGSGRLLAASLAAAAVLALVLLVSRNPSSPANPERDGTLDAARILEAVSPPDGGTVRREALAFTWRSQPGDPLYRLTIATSGGEAVWSRDTNDTTVAPPDSVRLAPGGKYFWYVDALDTAGLSITTGPRTVHITP